MKKKIIWGVVILALIGAVTSGGKKDKQEPEVETPAVVEPQKPAEAPQEAPKAEEVKTDAPVEEVPEKPAKKPLELPVVGNKNSKKYHMPGCSSVKDMKEANRVDFASADAAKAKGYEPCSRCYG